MSQILTIHATHPQARLLRQVADLLRAGGLAIIPTDTTYALVCHIGDKTALDRIRAIRRLDKQHHFTLMCRDLSELAGYARVDNTSYRILKHYTPGPFTFVLRASKDVPKRLVHPKKRTVGLRVPDNEIVQGLLEILGEPLMTSTARVPDLPQAQSDPLMLRERLGHQVDLVVDGGNTGLVSTTVVDLTSSAPDIIRQGLGDF